MKQRKPRKPRNMMALAMHNMCKPKSIPPKKGEGSKYNRKKDRKPISDPFFIASNRAFAHNWV